MYSKIALCLFLLACLLVGGECFPSGAPESACDTVAPNPAAQGGHGAQRQSTPVPYMITGLPNGNYTPGMDYTLTLTGNSSEMFRGFLVIARSGPTERVGTFTAMANSQTTCTDMRGITHTSRSDKTSVSFTWTAPPNGTGEVQFRFAVVQVVAIYWADQQSVTLQEGPPAAAGGGGNPANVSLPGILVTMLFALLGLSMMVGF